MPSFGTENRELFPRDILRARTLRGCPLAGSPKTPVNGAKRYQKRIDSSNYGE